MKYTAAIVALAATVIAIPTGGGGDSSGSCNNDHPNSVCCQSSGLLGGLFCGLKLLGSDCSGGSYCCKSAPQTGLINLGLECIKLL
ncbi:hypothetical protein E4U59_003562 [Claviceps monticola]|nr:hypothetical protein E4U59_003562 [Claviceps monticola]